MAIPRINGLSGQYMKNLYTKTKENNNGEEYRIDAHQKAVLMREIMDKVRAGTMSEFEGEQKIAEIKSAPEIFHVDEGSYSPKISPLQNEDSNTIQQLEEKQRQKEIKRLETDYKNGDISEFTYKVNMYFLTNPSSADCGHSLNIMA